MVIDNLDFFGISAGPAKANTELIVHTNAPLPGPIAFELLEPVAKWRAQIVDASGQLELLERPQRRTFDVRESGDPKRPNKALVSEHLNVLIATDRIVTLRVNNVNHD